jgi:Na+-transporting NADH:ubiquinone oxidoreductase subunit NqrC
MSTETKSLPGVWRRLGIILAYILVATLLLSAVVFGLSSHDCVQYGNCTDQDKLITKVASLVYWVFFAFFILAGWTGRLYGCRRS